MLWGSASELDGDRLHFVDLSEVGMYTALAGLLSPGVMLSLTSGKLSRDEHAEWNEAMSVAGVKDSFFIAAPHHCAVGTKPQ